MPDAYAGVPYNEVIQIRTPADTLIDTLGNQFTATIDSLRILSFKGLPNPLSYTCDNNRCVWVGDANGCATFTGTPTLGDVGVHDIDIVVLGTVGLGIFGQIEDTIIFKMRLEILQYVGIDEQAKSSKPFFTPNPMREAGTLTFVATEGSAYTFKLIDITGRQLIERKGNAQHGTNNLNINRENLPRGMYFYTLETNAQTHTGRIVIAD